MTAIITPDEIRQRTRNAHPVDALVLLKCAEEIERLTEHAKYFSSPLLKKHQPCGCVVCTCGGDRCLGCGAKNCGTHPVGEIPNPVYEDHPLVKERDQERELAEAKGWWKSASDALNKHIEKIAVLERELADVVAHRDSETRWAAQYKAERDEARERIAGLGGERQ